MRFSSSAIALSLVFTLAFPLLAAAQDDGSDAPASGGSVARIDALGGEVAIQRGDSDETLAAVQNAPVLSADYVTTGQHGRAEVGFDGHSAVRLGENVQIRFTSVDPADRQMQLAAGTIDLRLFGDTDGRSSIDTPSISVVPRTAGSFRVSVDSHGETAVTVRAGSADIVTPQGDQLLEPGTTLIADGPAANPSIQMQPAIALDDFDSYNGERDRSYLAATAQQNYVNTDIQGVGDLGADGRWVDDGSYGNVWMPSDVSPGWAPYRNGSWVWENGYGWTWVAAEPWGWAPYHYGRWYYSTAYQGWAWYPPAPGRFAPAWSPALVGFVGFNIGAVSVGIGFGNIGWVPLAPYEAYQPWWGPHGTTIVNNTYVNNTYVNNTYANNPHYRNLLVNGAMTSVTRANFQNGRFGNPTVVSQAQLHALRAVPMRGALPIVPSQANLRFTQHAVPPSLAVRPALMNRPFAGSAYAPRRVPFAGQQASVARTTHAAYGAPFGRPAGRPSYARPLVGNGYTSATPAYRFPQTPAYGRPAAPTYSRPPTPYSRPGMTYSQPPTSYSRPGMTYSRPPTPYSRPGMTYSRPGTAYSQPGAPYSRPAYSGNPQYNRQTSPAYARGAAPAYSRPAPAQPAGARSTRGNGGRRDR